MSQPIKRVLFVCVENANRSQIAEAFARMLGGTAVEAYSAGSHPSGVINPKAIATMAELGYDLTTHRTNSLDDLPDVVFDFVATLGCGDDCPFVIAHIRADWELPDPKYLEEAQYRQVRDDIGERVATMLKELGLPLINE